MKIGSQTFSFDNPPSIISGFSMVGPKEGKGPLGTYFDRILQDDEWGESSFEFAEIKIHKSAIQDLLDNLAMTPEQIDLFLGGDLLDQIISTNFTARSFPICFMGLFNACATFSEALTLASFLISSGNFNNIICSSSSHYASAERQFRFPLELGNQRTPLSQWTVTGAGAVLLASSGSNIKITAATIGKVIDLGIKDANNMGAVMAPAAAETLTAHFKDTGTKPSDYDLILTGDLGNFGSETLMMLMREAGYPLGHRYKDCGVLIYDKAQQVEMGGSGAGCSSTVFSSYLLKIMKNGLYKKVLFAPTGALMSKMSSLLGESIPAICHAVVIERV